MRVFNAIMVLVILQILGFMAYMWSFTDSNFGGYLGVALPVLFGVCLYGLGRAHHQHLS